jgi:hypothetical protein
MIGRDATLCGAGDTPCVLPVPSSGGRTIITDTGVTIRVESTGTVVDFTAAQSKD